MGDLVIPFDTTTILKDLAIAAGIMVAIQGLKNLLPGIFDKVPNLGRWIAALGVLLATLPGCLKGGIDVSCVINAVAVFLAAVGIYHSVAQSGGSVTPPLPPAQQPPVVGGPHP
jgi:hypothetical protein